MYTIIILVLLAGAAGLAALGVHRRKVALVVAGVLVALGTWAGFGLMGFWVDLLWFRSLQQEGRFWQELFWKFGSTIGAGLLGGMLACVLTLPFRSRWILRLATAGFCVFIGINWGWANWQAVVLYFHGVSPSMTDPIFGLSTGFYLFDLPFYDALHWLVLWIVLVCLLVSAAAVHIRVRGGAIIFPGRGMDGGSTGPAQGSLFPAGAALLVLWAVGQYLHRFHLLYSPSGAVRGAGWTDIHVRLPGYWIVGIASLLLAGVLLVRPLRETLLGKPIRPQLRRFDLPEALSQGAIVGTAIVAVVVLRIVALGVVPGLMQWLRVEPNEITFEKPFIGHNIRFTRHGFGLHNAEDREFPAEGVLTSSMVQANRDMFDNIRLWDYRALAQVYSQFQEIRLYYEFADVDIDRYTIDGQYRQVMVSARELKISNLPAESQTFINRHFKYTHGNGVALTTVSDFTPQGLPDLLIKDIPPVSSAASLNVRQPRIYYGELTDDFVIANSEEEEFDYPQGQKNVYGHYEGTGGVPIHTLWRKFLFGWKFGGSRLLLSGYPTAESRIMFRRNIRERVRTLAPFLHFDRDPYITLIDGKLCWILDAYTTSRRFPYSESFDSRGMGDYAYGREGVPPAREVRYLEGVNYIRNSVKCVIDAYDGSVDLFVMDPEDPIIQTWWKVFPDLFTPREQMSPELFAHIRYPADLLLVQGLVHAKYHMKDPEVFYNLEDLWVRATEKYYQSVRAVQPYYIMWTPPDSGKLQYVLMLPFTPKNKQVLIGWIAGMCDGENYGRFLSYRFPKERRLIGPQQVETKIDQHPELSAKLSLWDQRGSKVIRGNVLAIPVAETMIYVEPIYLQAETAAYPELRLVVLMHKDRLSYAETFEDALQGLFREVPASDAEEPARIPPATERQPTGRREELINRANRAFENYLRFTGEKNFRRASEELDTLRKTLEELEAGSPLKKREMDDDASAEP